MRTCNHAHMTTGMADYRRDLQRRGLAASSIDKRLRLLRRIEDWLEHPLVEATTDEIEVWLDELGLADRTRYAYVSHVACFFRWAVITKRADHDPTLEIVRPKVGRLLPRPIPDGDLAVAFECAGPKMRAWLTLGAYGGLRCQEIAYLERSEVREQHAPPILVVLHGKGRKQRVVPLAVDVENALNYYGLPSSGPVFPHPTNRKIPVEPWRVSQDIGRYLAGLGIHATAHQLRHWFGTNVYGRTGDLRLTQELLGHSNPSTTAGYAAWSPEKAAKVVRNLSVSGFNPDQVSLFG